VFIRILIFGHILVTPTSDMTVLYSIMETTEETVCSAVFRIAVQLPHVWPELPAVWFAHRWSHSSGHSSNFSETIIIMWYGSSTCSKPPMWKTSSLNHRCRSLTNDLRQSCCAGFPLHGNSA